MKYALVILLVVGLLAVAGDAIAPSVCVTVNSNAGAIVAFVSDPQPDLIVGPNGLADAGFC